VSYRVDVKDPKVLSGEQLGVVQKILEESCVGEICIRRSIIFEETKKHIVLDMELYRFEQVLTHAIKKDLLPGFTTRPGRSGGICRTGAFSKRDEERKSKHPVSVKKQCYITIDKLTYKVPIAEDAARNFILNILQARPADGNRDIGDIFLNNEPFSLLNGITATMILKNYVFDSRGTEIEKPVADNT
jgi:hypothetical protein